MSKTKILMATIAVVAALSVTATAQQQARVSLRSGERFSGEIMGFNGADYTFRVDGRDRRISANEIAIVEMAAGRPLTGQQQAGLNAGRPFVILRSGEVVEGRLTRMSQNAGRRQQQIIIESRNGQRSFYLGDVAGIYVTAPRVDLADSRRGSQDRFGDRQGNRQDGGVGDRQGGSANDADPRGGFGGGSTNGGRGSSTQNDRGGASPAAPSSATVVAPGTQQWVTSTFTVKAGETLRFQASGQVQYSPDPEDRAEPQGSPKRHTVAGAPMPTMPGGSLIGRIDNGPAFWIGNQSTVNMPSAGTLFIGINDDRVADNSGQFNVVISR